MSSLCKSKTHQKPATNTDTHKQQKVKLYNWVLDKFAVTGKIVCLNTLED